jgi:hypothetical protein
MSENLDLVRSIYIAWSDDDYRSIAWADAEIEFVKADGPDPGSWRGVREMSRVWAENRVSFEEFHTVAAAFRELDAERVSGAFAPLGTRQEESAGACVLTSATGLNALLARFLRSPTRLGARPA